MPTLEELEFETSAAADALQNAATQLQQTPSLTIIAELQKYPEMLLWVKQGSSYHQEHGLEMCLLCGGELSKERKELLERVLDEGFQPFVVQLEEVRETLVTERERYLKAVLDLAPSKDVSADLRNKYDDASTRLKQSFLEAVESVLSPAVAAIDAKLAHRQLRYGRNWRGTTTR
jgi:wobble nucleotide-excising tRNase